MNEAFATAPSLTAAGAQRALDAAAAHARDIGVAACIAVTDRAGHLLAFLRMDGAPVLSIRLAQDKAYSVAAFTGLPTHEWYGLLEDEPALLHGIVKTPRLTIFGGGVPVLVDGALAGAVGASGGSAEQDRAVAEAGAAGLR